MPAFIDFTADRAALPSVVSPIADDPFAPLRQTVFADPKRGFSLGLATGDGIARSFPAYPLHEFFLVRRGRLTIATATDEAVFGPGEAGVLPRGLACRLQASDDCLRVFGVSTSMAGAAAALVRIDPDGPLEPVGFAAEATTLTRPLPAISRRVDFQLADGSLVAGIWHSEAFRRVALARQDHEFMQIALNLAEVDREEETGTTRRAYPAGAAFFAEDGAVYALGSDRAFSKIFCVCTV